MSHPELLLIGEISDEVRSTLAEQWTLHDDHSADYLENNGQSISAVLTNGHDGCSRGVIEALPQLGIIASNGVGYDAIDTDAAVARNVIATHTPNVLNKDVANLAIALLLATSRELIPADQWVRSGQWQSQGAFPLGRSIEGMRVGLLGMGRIGQTIAGKLVAAFDAEIHYHARSKKEDIPYSYHATLTALAEAVDALIVITPGGESTFHLVDHEVIDALGSSGTLINVARGSVVDEAALVEALQDGRLGAAGLDVFEQEPAVPEALINMPNVILTPHIGSATHETRAAMMQLVLDNLQEFREHGRALTPVPECQHL